MRWNAVYHVFLGRLGDGFMLPEVVDFIILAGGAQLRDVVPVEVEAPGVVAAVEEADSPFVVGELFHPDLTVAHSH